MISSSAFDSINLLDKAADASVKRETVIANNIANADTPRYKRKDIDFSKMLMEEIMRLAEPEPIVPTETRYYPREYGIQYATKYGSLPNGHETPLPEGEEFAEGGIEAGDLLEAGKLKAEMLASERFGIGGYGGGKIASARFAKDDTGSEDSGSVGGKASGIDGANVGVIAEKLDVSKLRPKVFTEYKGLSYRIDKNNVDPDAENVELASEQIKYQVLTQSMSHEFSQLKTVLMS